MTLVAIRFIDRIGRKPLLLFGNAGMVISLIVLSFLISFRQYLWCGMDDCHLLRCVHRRICRQLGPIVWVMLPELFPFMSEG
ncbi:MFS transporter [Bacillus licheniformis]|nr:MFS transporter [Bacillus licheniformis]